MKRFLTLFVAVAISTALFVPAMAQSAGPGQGGPRSGGGPGEKRGGGMMMRGKMKEVQTRVLGKLGLTDKQKAAIKALDAKTEREMAALRKAPKAGEKPTRPSEATMEKMRAISKAHQDGMMKILTKEQQEKYKKLMAEEMKKLRAEREKSGAGRPGGKPGGSKP